MNSTSKHLITAAFAAWATAANADLLVGNLDQPTRAISALNSNFWAAQSFVTGDGDELRLTSIDALLSASALAEAGTEYVAELHQSGPGAIGALLTTLSFADGVGATPQAVSLLPDAPVTLAADTTYWLVLGERHGSLDTEFLGWSYAHGNGQSGAGTLGAFGYSSDGGASWNASTFDTPNPYQMAVYVSAVPEPSSVAMSIAGLALLLAIRRRASGAGVARS